MCAADGCEGTVYARSLCGRHDKQMRRHGAVQPEAAPRRCAAEGCDRDSVTRGWCHGHYLRWSRHGDVKADLPLTRPIRADCRVDGCERPGHSGGLCRTHVGRQRAKGTADEEVPVRGKGGDGSISHGYRKVVVPESLLELTGGERNVLEHRLVMAQSLGRALLPGEVVHHKNGDRLDNRVSNLELWSVAQPQGQRVEDKLRFAYELIALYDPAGFAALQRAADPGPKKAENPSTT